MRLFLLSLVLFQVACSSVPKLDSSFVRPWVNDLDKESPSNGPYIAHHKRGQYELIYLAAHHDNNRTSDTFRLVDKLLSEFPFDALIIEPIPYSEGESPEWFVKEARKGMGSRNIAGGESSVAVVRSVKKGIPFYGAELDHRQIFQMLKDKGYSEQDILGFYLARQIPQWVREGETKKGVVERKSPKFLAHFCKAFEIKSESCPNIKATKAWYLGHMGKELSGDVSTEDVAPISGSPLFTHKISSTLGSIRDRYALTVIEQLLIKYKRVGVVYGGSHYLTLRKSLDLSLGKPVEIVFPD
jgi:hypothetical protein